MTQLTVNYLQPTNTRPIVDRTVVKTGPFVGQANFLSLMNTNYDKPQDSF